MSEFRFSDPLLRRIVYALGIMSVIVFGFYTISLFKDAITLILNALTPFLGSLLMAYLLSPLVFILQKRLKLGRIMGTLVLYIIIFLAVFLLLAVLIPKILSEFIRLSDMLKTVIPDLLIRLSKNEYLQIDAELVRFIESKIRELELDYEKILAYLLPGLKKMASGGIEAVGMATKGIFISLSSVVGFFSFLMLVGIINFYLIIDWEKIMPLIRKMIPAPYRSRTFDVLSKIDIAVGGFLRGQLTVSAIVGTCFALGLFIMGFTGFPALRNYCILIGSAAAVGGFIPYLGPLIGVAPAVLIILLSGGVTWSVKFIALTALLALFGLIQAVEGFILQPRIVGKGAGLHPLVVMLALIFGSQFGIGGMIVAVPTASILRVLIREFYWLRVLSEE